MYMLHAFFIYLFNHASISSLSCHCSIRFLISPIEGHRRVGGRFVSIVVPWVLITMICGATGNGRVVVCLTIFCFQCLINTISIHSFTVMLSSAKCTWYVGKLFYHLWIISPQNHYGILFLFSLKAGVSSLWRFCRRWWYRELSLRQITVPWMTAGFVGLMTVVLNARLTWYLHSI